VKAIKIILTQEGDDMDDARIVELYWQRDERAVAETQNKYGKYCFTIADNILQNKEDSEECVNDTYVGAWNAIPPHRPEILRTFVGKITRRCSLKKLREKSAKKRGNSEVFVSFDELEECIADGRELDAGLEAKELAEVINEFLESVSETERRIFVCRYWYFDSIKDISRRYGFGESKVKMTLKRTRDKLSEWLNDEGITI
jgi:RNA polymerase sigma-70 factor (ECF subfamily)